MGLTREQLLERVRVQKVAYGKFRFITEYRGQEISCISYDSELYDSIHNIDWIDRRTSDLAAIHNLVVRNYLNKY